MMKYSESSAAQGQDLAVGDEELADAHDQNITKPDIYVASVIWARGGAGSENQYLCAGARAARIGIAELTYRGKKSAAFPRKALASLSR